MLHFAKDHAAPDRTDTLVSVVSIMSTRTNPVQNVVFQAAAPKVIGVFDFLYVLHDQFHFNIKLNLVF